MHSEPESDLKTIFIGFILTCNHFICSLPKVGMLSYIPNLAVSLYFSSLTRVALPPPVFPINSSQVATDLLVFLCGY